jgi:sugar lactone lactonase YvrE
MNRKKLLGQGFALLAATLATAGLAIAADSENRGLLDSTIDTIVGGNPGHTFALADAKRVVLRPNLMAYPGVARDATGNIYWTDYQRIMKRDSAGTVTVVAGVFAYNGFQGDGDLAVRALLDSPGPLAVDSAGNLYIADNGNYRIRKITVSTGIISTVAGNGNNVTFEGDGLPALSVGMSGGIRGLAVDASGNIFFTEAGVIRKVSSSGVISTLTGRGWSLAGSGVTDGEDAYLQTYNDLNGIVVDSAGDLIFCDTGRNMIKKLTLSTGKITIVAGRQTAAGPPAVYATAGNDPAFPDNGTVAATAATQGLWTPTALAIDGSDLYFFDLFNDRIRKFTVGGNMQTVMGDSAGGFPGGGFRGDGTAAVTSTAGDTSDDAMLNMGSSGMAVAGGVVTFLDQSNLLLRQVSGGNVSTLVGAYNPHAGYDLITDTGAVNALGAPIQSPSAVTVDKTSDVPYFVATDWFGERKIYKHNATAGTIEVVAGVRYSDGLPVASLGDGGPATGASFNILGGFAVNSAGDVFVADPNNHVVRKIASNGTISTVAGIPWYAGYDVLGVEAGTTAANPDGKSATAVPLNTPRGVAVDSTNLYIADTGNCVVRQVNLSSGLITTVAGTVGVGADNGAADPQAALSAQFRPFDLAVSGGVVYILDNAARRVRRLNGANVELVVGDGVNGYLAGTDGDGVGTDVRLNQPMDIEVVGSSLYIADTGNHIIRKVNLTAGATFGDTTNIAGTVSTAGFTGDGAAATACRLNRPTNIAVSGTSIAVADSNNDRVRVFTEGGNINTVAGNGVSGGTFGGSFSGNGGVSTSAELDLGKAANQINGLAFIGTDLILGDWDNNQIRRFAANGTGNISAFAGTGDFHDYAGEGGPALTAKILNGAALRVAGGYLYFTDSWGVRRIKLSDNGIETFAGIPGRVGFNGNGLNKTQTLFYYAYGLDFDSAGNLIVSDYDNYIVRKVAASDGAVSLVAGHPQEEGSGGHGYTAATQSWLEGPGDLLVDDADNIYFTDGGHIRAVTNVGILETKAGIGSYGHDAFPFEWDATEAYISPVGICMDKAGNMFIANHGSYNQVLRLKLGKIQVVAGRRQGLSTFYGLNVPSLLALFGVPVGGVAFKPEAGDLLVCDVGNNRLRKISNLASTSNTPPTAIIVATPKTQGTIPFKVRLDGSASVDPDGDIVIYAWDFEGDGVVDAYGPIVEFTYTAKGSYNVTLTVTDSAGQSSTATQPVFAATPLILSQSAGSGSFKVDFKSANKDAFSLKMVGVDDLVDVAGQEGEIQIGSYAKTFTAGGKGIKTTAKDVKVVIDAAKKAVSAALKGVNLRDAFEELGVENETTIGNQSVTVPFVMVFGTTLTVGDEFAFIYNGKYNSSASGKWKQ